MYDGKIAWRQSSPSPFSRKSRERPRSASPCKLSPSDTANWCNLSHCERVSRTVMETVSPLPRFLGASDISCAVLLLCRRVKDASPVCLSLIDILPYPLPEFSNLLCGFAVRLKFRDCISTGNRPRE